MKDYRILYREAKGDLPRIYCDMDGVLADFMVASRKATGTTFTQDQSDKHWKTIRNTKNFWANMPWMRDGKQLWNYIKKYNPHILSAYTIEDPNCKAGKNKWLRKELGYTQNFMINLVRRREKKDFAMKSSDDKRQPAILIDDYPKNVDQFKAAGGIGILHTSASNTISQLKRLGF